MRSGFLATRGSLTRAVTNVTNQNVCLPSWKCFGFLYLIDVRGMEIADVLLPLE